MKILKRCVLGLLFLFLMFQVFPAEAKPPKGKAKVDTKWEKKADKNQDGIVGPRERGAWQKHKSEVDTGWEKKADTNQNGAVDKKELSQWKDEHPMPPGFKRKADLNNDGILDDKEYRLWKEKHSDTEIDGEKK